MVSSDTPAGCCGVTHYRRLLYIRCLLAGTQLLYVAAYLADNDARVVVQHCGSL